MAVKLTLEAVNEEPISVVLISAPMRDYRLAWLLNSNCSCDFVKSDSFSFKNPRIEDPLEFSLYKWLFEDEQEILLLSNRCDNILLDTELPHVDFFFIINDNPSSDLWPQNIRKLRGVTLTQDANPNVLIRIRHILDELEMQQMFRKSINQSKA